MRSRHQTLGHFKQDSHTRTPACVCGSPSVFLVKSPTKSQIQWHLICIMWRLSFIQINIYSNLLDWSIINSQYKTLQGTQRGSLYFGKVHRTKLVHYRDGLRRCRDTQAAIQSRRLIWHKLYLLTVGFLCFSSSSLRFSRLNHSSPHAGSYPPLLYVTTLSLILLVAS